MKDFLELVLLGFIAVCLVALVVLIVSLPFAFLGWILLSFVGLFATTAAVTYFNSVIAGLGSVVIVMLLGAIFK